MLTVYPLPATVITGLILLYWFKRRLGRSRLQAVARERAQSKRSARDKRRGELLSLLCTKYSAYLPSRAMAERIGQSTGTELLKGLQRKDFTYTEVILVLALRALKIGQAINCVTEEFYDQALTYAFELDAQTNEHDARLLKGIPISIKDQIDQQGADSSMGMAMRNFRPASSDSLIVELLKQQGALVGFARTATIQGMLLPDTESETYGVADNPFDSTRITGGSSGKSIDESTKRSLVLV